MTGIDYWQSRKKDRAKRKQQTSNWLGRLLLLIILILVLAFTFSVLISPPGSTIQHHPSSQYVPPRAVPEPLAAGIEMDATAQHTQVNVSESLAEIPPRAAPRPDSLLPVGN